VFGIDDDNDTRNQDYGETMDILDLKEALLECPTFSYILFDACDMQDIEVAYELKDCANYFIASPSEVSAYGAPYDDVVPAFFTEEDAAAAIAEAYFGYYEDNYSYSDGDSPARGTNGNDPGSYDGGGSSEYQYGTSISVIDASKLEDLATATSSILSAYISDSSTISTSDVYSYDDNYINCYYDLDNFIKTLTDGDSNYTTWKAAFDEAVPVFYTTEYTYNSYANDGDGGMVSMDDASGVGTFIPNNADFTDAYIWAYYLKAAEMYPQYSYLTDLVESYQEYYEDYYTDLAWNSAAGWSAIGW
jgi:hypothetical protein